MFNTTAEDLAAFCERFWEKVDKSGSDPRALIWQEKGGIGPCWFWTASKDRYDYGCVNVFGVKHGSHRVAYEILVEPIPEGMDIDHLCRNRDCVNPDHMECVPPIENWRRGESLSRQNSLKTHCDHGHLFDEENTLLVNGGKNRKCKTCNRENSKRYRASLKREGPRLPKPSKEQLAEEMEAMTWAALGRKYGVSDVAVRKWAKGYGLLP